MTSILFVLLTELVGTQAAQPTFYKDVLPILQHHCQVCHRPGQLAPMPLLTYVDARPWARAIKAAVVRRTMPPWFADPAYGHFLNDPSLSEKDIATVVAWVDSGTLEGAPADAPPPIAWAVGWLIRPDLVVAGPTVEVPAHPDRNVIEWLTVTVPSGFTHDTWITSVEIRPEHPEVAHHICLGFNPHTPDVEYFHPVWEDKTRDPDGSAVPGERPTFKPTTDENRLRSMTEDCYLPGNPANDYRTFGAAKLIPAGSDITLNLHYTPVGRAVTDHVQIGFTVMQMPPARRYVSLSASAPTDAAHFAIPPHASHYASPPAVVAFNREVELVFLMPHMHVRGKDTTFTLEFPDGRREIVLRVPHYDFAWQLGYAASIHVPQGTRLRVDAHFDNSAANKANPNPTRTVYYGEMTWEEMMFPFFGVIVDVDANPKNLITRVRLP
jgi:hypothetical protein